METKAITEGALMAALSAAMAIASIFIPFLDPILAVVWALPVVVICLRWGMRAGIATMAVAGIVIMLVTMPIYAFEMLCSSAAPALLLGYGLLRKWKSETTILVTTVAASAGFAAAYVIAVNLLGISFEDYFMLQPERADEFVAVFTEYARMNAQGTISAEAIRQIVETAFAMTRYLVPSIIVLLSLFSALANYIAANFILNRLKIQLPSVTKLSMFRLPFNVIFIFILGYGMNAAFSAFWPSATILVKIGQNLMLVMHAAYFFQGAGLVQYFIGKAPPGMRRFWNILLFVTALWTNVFFFLGMGYLGVADALFDFRRIGAWFKGEIEKRRRDI